jgi:hypothetical protein
MMHNLITEPGTIMKNGINALTMSGLTGILIFGSIFAAQMAQIILADKDIWWTHQEKPLSFEQSISSVELSLSGKTLRQHLADGTLFAVDAGGKQYPAVPQDITVRLNNWNEVQNRMLSSALFSAFCTGASFACFVLGLTELRKNRKSTA